MIKIVALNSLKNGSPAKIMGGILECAEKKMYAETFPFYGVWKDEHIEGESFGIRLESQVSGILSKVTGFHGIWNFFGTYKLIRKMNRISPDIVHLHNIHMWNINIPMLFEYIKKNDIHVVWTLHDCWAFTGQCPYFSAIGCEKWTTGCGNCKQLKRYPGSIIDNTKLMYRLKKKWFSNVDNMVLVTPSQWLLGLVRKSFLKEYRSICINNGIDLEKFSPQDSDFRKKFSLENKRIILGVALEWGYRKGLDIFIELSKVIDSRYVIVLVGYNGQLNNHNIITIARTSSQTELAQIYSASNVFLNPTREDNFPTVNIEALACGTPVITYDNGGSREMLDESCGIVLDNENITILKDTIDDLLDNNRIKRLDCRKKALEFDYKRKFEDYIELYKKVLGDIK